MSPETARSIGCAFLVSIAPRSSPRYSTSETAGVSASDPLGEFRTERRYLPETNVLETTFHCPTGTFVLRDLMLVSSEEQKRASLTPEHEVLREIEGLAGEVEVEILYEPRPDYGRIRPGLKDRGRLGIRCEVNGALLMLRSELPLELAGDGRSAQGVVRIRAGERKYLSFNYSNEAPAVVPPLGEAARERLERTVRWWHEWADRCAYRGPYRDAVVRSALALKLMTYAPSGALVAAPTTSLPEAIGGVRNWDYRYCWLRDASFTLRALSALGYDEEAEAFLGWMLHATRLTWPELQVLYDVFGEAQAARAGVGASGRLRRLAPGARSATTPTASSSSTSTAKSSTPRRGSRVEAGASTATPAGMLDGLGHTVCRRWREPDEGIWEGRSGRFHHTHSKVLCWVALDRLIKMHEADAS